MSKTITYIKSYVDFTTTDVVKKTVYLFLQSAW